MKTILYQPLFINPQAYFVFPQLYHIEKGDSYIEPANITGQLIINDLTQSLTSTPILNVVQDTNQVDSGLFKGKHIRISQYTNIGAVVLGEWYIDQLCYDGKMYAVAYDMPILTDYTVMAERTILDNSDIADWAFIAKRDYPAINGAFTFEKDIDDTSDNLRTISFGRTSVIYNPIKERSISYQTKNKYNGQDIIVGNVDDVDFLLIGAGILDTNLNLVKEKMRVAHGNILLFNRSLTEYEISWVKNNMMCSKPQEPDIDL